MAGVAGVGDSASLRVFPSPVQAVTVAFLFLGAGAVAAIAVIAITIVTIISVAIGIGRVYPTFSFQQSALPFALTFPFPGAPLFQVAPLLVVALRFSPPDFTPVLLSVPLDFLPNLMLLHLRLSVRLNSGLSLMLRAPIIVLRLVITPILRLNC
ncbi:MAG TPA: hypothetical protein VIC84_25555 [Blastocatellia bacterium]